MVDARTRVIYLSELFSLLSSPTNCCLTVSFRYDRYRFSPNRISEKRKKEMYDLQKYVPVPVFRCTFKRLTIGMFGNSEHGIGSPSPPHFQETAISRVDALTAGYGKLKTVRKVSKNDGINIYYCE